MKSGILIIINRESTMIAFQQIFEGINKIEANDYCESLPFLVILKLLSNNYCHELHLFLLISEHEDRHYIRRFIK